MILPRGPQRVFFVLTLIVMLVIIQLAGSLGEALMYTSLITQFLVITTLATGVAEKHDKALSPAGAAVVGGAGVWYPGAYQQFDSDPEHAVEGFATSPMEFAPGGTHMNPDLEGYPGGLEPSDLYGAGYDIGATATLPAGSGAIYSPTSGAFATGADGPALPPYNPFQLNRLASRAEPGPRTTYGRDGPVPIGMDLANEARSNFDGDRMMVEHARWRNDGQRVAAGIMRRKALVEKYVREELDEKENEPWWGRHEL